MRKKGINLKLRNKNRRSSKKSISGIIGHTRFIKKSNFGEFYQLYLFI